ncbi:MAG: DUF3788 domain-containing protein [Eubacteriaceae bacterium]|nr:DUF3788 domain-containing protein [Eubacteriaceae bacterium]
MIKQEVAIALINQVSLFDKNDEPASQQITEFVSSSLWDNLENYLQQTHKSKPKAAYSACLLDGGNWEGWNVKYKKSGKALCTLYPKQGYFSALIPVGLKEINDVELLLPSCSEYTRDLFNNTRLGHAGKSLAVEV